ncbi:MAG: hypothetical protein KatS3mg019_1701 [Fimbriimonadales bacterium]|nr:MAG: hypothetical protein KatS3mg019_1701 [Fimbriimonadales bacterium]
MRRAYHAIWICLALSVFAQCISSGNTSSSVSMVNFSQTDKAPQIEVNIPDGALYWIGQTPCIKVSIRDDSDPSPSVRALLNGNSFDVSKPLFVEDEGMYILYVEAKDNSGNRAYKSVAFAVLPLPKFQLDVQILWSDFHYDKNEAYMSIDMLLALRNSRIYPNMIIDTNDPRVQRTTICRVSPYSWTMIITNGDGEIISEPISSSYALCNCLEDVAVVSFQGKVSVLEEPQQFVILGVSANTQDTTAEYFVETLPRSLIEYKASDRPNLASFSPCPSPGGTSPCSRRCIWIPRYNIRPGNCGDYYFNSWCLAEAGICEYSYDGYAGSRIEGEAFAQDNCVGCIANANCLVSGKVHASLIHVNLCPPCEWQKVNATAAPEFKSEVRISSSNGLGGDRKAVAAGVINVYVHGGGCQFAATALSGCQVGSSNPISVNLGGGYGSNGQQVNFGLTLTWNGTDSDSCIGQGNGVCAETSGTSIRAQIVTALKMLAFANGGLTNVAPIWAEVHTFDSKADTQIGGRCPNASKNLRIP